MLKVLWFEDDSLTYRQLRAVVDASLRIAMRRHPVYERGGERVKDVSFFHYTDPFDAIDKVRGGVEFSLAICDIFFEDNAKKLPTGLRLAETCRSERPTCGIIAISASEDSEAERDYRSEFARVAKCADSGPLGTHGCRFIRKAEIEKSWISFEQLGTELVNALLEAGALERTGTATSIDLSLRTYDSRSQEHYALHRAVAELGLDRIREVATQFCELEEGAGELSYVAPGRSGAQVLQLHTERGRDFLLKFSRQRYVLEKELESVPSVGSGMRRLFVDYSTPVRASNDDSVFALAAGFFSSAQSLSRRLCNAPDKNKCEVIGQVVHSLVREYESTCRADDSRSPFRALLLDEGRAARALGTLKELESLAIEEAKGLGPNFNAEIIRDAIQLSAPRLFGLDVDASREHAQLTMAHGDLHGQNILIESHGLQFRLIDPAEVGYHHWAGDLSRLAADIVASCVDQGAGEHRWGCFSQWRQLVWRLTADLGEDCTCGSTWGEVLSVLRQALERLAESVSGQQLEIRASLAMEFLRVAYREFLPSPKRVLGLVAASDLLST